METKVERIAHRCVRQDWLSSNEAAAMFAACEFIYDFNKSVTGSNSFAVLYGLKAVQGIQTLMEPYNVEQRGTDADAGNQTSGADCQQK